MGDPIIFPETVHRPCTHLTLSPIPGTRFMLYLKDMGDGKKQTRVRIEYQKGRERELAAHLLDYIDRHLMRFVPMPTAESLLDSHDDVQGGEDEESDTP